LENEEFYYWSQGDNELMNYIERKSSLVITSDRMAILGLSRIPENVTSSAFRSPLAAFFVMDLSTASWINDANPKLFSAYAIDVGTKDGYFGWKTVSGYYRGSFQGLLSDEWAGYVTRSGSGGFNLDLVSTHPKTNLSASLSGSSLSHGYSIPIKGVIEGSKPVDMSNVLLGNDTVGYKFDDKFYLVNIHNNEIVPGFPISDIVSIHK
jgi:hypothetical protein